MALLLNRLYAPLTALATARLDVVTALVSFERVFEVLDIRPLIVESADPSELPDGPLSIEFDAVEFRYPSADQISLASLEEVAVLDDREGEQVLHRVSFCVEPGQTVALVGSSGAGKSTLVSLVPRLYDVDAGAVRLGGVDVRELSFASMRDAVGVVTQDGHLFHDTIRANLVYASPEASDAEIWDALTSARLADLIRSLPDGLETVVGRARVPPVGWRTPAADDRPAADRQASCGHPRRSDGSPRLRVRTGGAGGTGRGPGRTYRAGHRPPPVDDPCGRCDLGDRGRRSRRARYPRRAAGRRWALLAPVPHPVRRDLARRRLSFRCRRSLVATGRARRGHR